MVIVAVSASTARRFLVDDSPRSFLKAHRIGIVTLTGGGHQAYRLTFHSRSVYSEMIQRAIDELDGPVVAITFSQCSWSSRFNEALKRNRNCRLLRFEHVDFQGGVMPSLNAHPQLLDVQFMACDLRGASLDLPRTIRSVALSDSEGVSCATIESIANLDHLVTLLCDGTSIDDSCVDSVSKFPALRCFSAIDTHVTSRAAMHLVSHATALTVRIADTQISDATINPHKVRVFPAHFRTFPGLIQKKKRTSL